MISETDESLVAKLLSENEEYKSLTEEHEELDRRVAELAEKKYLLPDEELELKKLKKTKMAGKEKMYQIMERAR